MTPRRGLLGLGLALLAGGGASAQSMRRQRRSDEPLPLPPPAPPPPPAEDGSEPAPVPNRDIEAPRNRESATTRIDPAFIDPDEPRYGATSDRHGVQAREDRLLRNPAPGARLRVPLPY